MHFGLAFKHIQARCRNAFFAQGNRQRSVVHNAAARDVDQRGGGLHQRQFFGTDGVVRFGRIRYHQHDVVSRF